MKATTGEDTDQLVSTLREIGRTPLSSIRDDQVTDVVGRIVDRKADRPTVDVAAFNSAI